MAAGVHDRYFGSCFVLDDSVACVWQACLLFQREGVHVCAKKHCGSGSIVQNACDSVSADVGIDFIA
jgi:hypothetical protein